MCVYVYLFFKISMSKTVTYLQIHVFLLFVFRTYAVRRIRDAFRENKHIKDSEKIEELVNKAKANLEVIRRQVCLFLSFYLRVVYSSVHYTTNGKNKSVLKTSLDKQ